jgi:hypothetical protein
MVWELMARALLRRADGESPIRSGRSERGAHTSIYWNVAAALAIDHRGIQVHSSTCTSDRVTIVLLSWRDDVARMCRRRPTTGYVG